GYADFFDQLAVGKVVFHIAITSAFGLAMVFNQLFDLRCNRFLLQLQIALAIQLTVALGFFQTGLFGRLFYFIDFFFVGATRNIRFFAFVFISLLGLFCVD